jgi:hypothetical protein
MVNRTQALVLGIFLLAWTSLLVILVAAREVYDQALGLPTGHRTAELGLLAALTGFIALLAIGVVRRWRWAFWLILVAFLFGVLRVPVASLQLVGVLAGPCSHLVRRLPRAARCRPVRHRARHGGQLPSRWRVGGVLSTPAAAPFRRPPISLCHLDSTGIPGCRARGHCPCWPVRTMWGE